jgi:hypothetical protein
MGTRRLFGWTIEKIWTLLNYNYSKISDANFTGSRLLARTSHHTSRYQPTLSSSKCNIIPIQHKAFNYNEITSPGSAYSYETEDSQDMEHTLRGTPYFMAPEVYGGKKQKFIICLTLSLWFIFTIVAFPSSNHRKVWQKM